MNFIFVDEQAMREIMVNILIDSYEFMYYLD